MGQSHAKNKINVAKNNTLKISNIRHCQCCKHSQAKYVRELDVLKVPQKYILTPENVCYEMLHGNRASTNIIDLINFPKDLVITKYRYYVCEKCYILELPKTLEWNYWKNL